MGSLSHISMIFRHHLLQETTSFFPSPRALWFTPCTCWSRQVPDPYPVSGASSSWGRILSTVPLLSLLLESCWGFISLAVQSRRALYPALGKLQSFFFFFPSLLWSVYSRPDHRERKRKSGQNMSLSSWASWTINNFLLIRKITLLTH